MNYHFWGVRRDPEEIVTVESMGFTWRLPWKTVEADVESGFSTLLEETPAGWVAQQGIGE